MEEVFYIYETLDGKYPSNRDSGFAFSYNFRWVGYTKDMEPYIFDQYRMRFRGEMTRSELDGYIVDQTSRESVW